MRCDTDRHMAYTDRYGAGVLDNQMHKLQFNLSRIFKNIYEVTVFVINWACWGAKLRATFIRNVGARIVTAALVRWFDRRIFFLWLFYASYSSHLQNSTFHFLHFLVAKDIQDSLVSKRWKIYIYKANYFLGSQSKLAELGGLSVLENDELYRWRANWTLQCSKRFVKKNVSW